jgi:hypothetical protein
MGREKCTFTVTSVNLWYSAEVRCVIGEVAEEARWCVIGEVAEEALEVWMSKPYSWRRTATVRRII